MTSPKKVPTKNVPFRALQYASIVTMLMDRDGCTVKYLHEQLGWSEAAINGVLRAFRLKRHVFVWDWEEDRLGRRSVPVYKWGKAADLPRPLLSPEQIIAKKRERWRNQYKRRMLAAQLQLKKKKVKE